MNESQSEWQHYACPQCHWSADVRGGVLTGCVQCGTPFSGSPRPAAALHEAAQALVTLHEKGRLDAAIAYRTDEWMQKILGAVRVLREALAGGEG